MPLYDFRCTKGHKFERRVKLADFASEQLCHCHAVAERLISAPRIIVENVGYTCPITDKWVGSKLAHNENLRQHDCRVLETGEKELVSKQRADDEAKFERSVDETVERTIDAMPSAKKEKLANELTHGADLAVSRN